MNRQTWLRDRRAQAERWYTANAPTYDEREPSSPVHATFLARVVASVDVDGTILDAACGTGRHFDAILGAGRRVVGIDQSSGMLDQARLRHSDVQLEQLGLQELAFRDAFDAAMCIDAMEYVPPEDWPVVLRNLRRAVRPGALVYLTIEEIDRGDVDRAYTEALEAGLPVVPGEHHRRGGGYHFYPARDRVAAWIAGARLEIVAEDASPGANYAYWHLLARRPEIGETIYDDDIVAAAWADHRDELTAFLVRSTRDHELAEDILQDAYLRLLREVRAGRSPRVVRPWLYRVAGNLVIDRRRRQTSARRYLDRIRGPIEPALFDEPTAAILDQEAVRERLQAIEGLGPRARHALLLAADGSGGQEVAQAIGCSHVAARALLHRARIRARTCLST